MARRFASPDAALAALEAAFGPKNDPAWRFEPGRRPALVREAPGAPVHVKRFHAATTATMHFGLVTVDLAAGTVTFVDEDHRDGGDTELARATLPPDWLAALRALDW